MLTTTIYGLKKPESTDSADLTVFVGDNMDLIESALSSSGNALQQYSKLDVIASQDVPYVKDLTVSDNNFLFQPVEILQFIPQQDNVVKNIYSFDNGDSTNFNVANTIEFDGTMHLKTDYSGQMTAGTIDSGVVYSYPIDITPLQNIVSLVVT